MLSGRLLTCFDLLRSGSRRETMFTKRKEGGRERGRMEGGME